LSTPLLSDDQLVGVLTVYSATADGFNEDHRRIIEVVARQIAHTFKRAAEFDNSSRRDPLTGLPNLKQLEQLVDATGIDRVTRDSHFTLLFIDVAGLKQINSMHGSDVGDDALRWVVRHSRSGLRVADVLFRYSTNEFVALLNNTDMPTAKVMAHQIIDDIRKDQFQVHGGATLTIEAAVTCVSAPRDGESLDELVASARARLAPSPYHRDPSIVH
jgi:diguanylate cyclase (GGDEF)-like protein